jgi:PhoPQ-activated pathogenicity-related protein
MISKKIIAVILVLLLIALAVFAIYTVTKDGQTEISKTCTTYNNSVEEQCIEDYIGLSQEAAIERAEQYHYIPKIISIDGTEQVVDDIGGAIIYLEIENGSVTKAYFEEGRGL